MNDITQISLMKSAVICLLGINQLNLPVNMSKKIKIQHSLACLSIKPMEY